MAGEGADLAANGVRAAFELIASASTSGFSISVKIDSPILAGFALAGALTLGAFYFSKRQSVENAIRNALEERNENGADPEVRNIGDGSILVELCCHTDRSLLQFVDDLEAEKVKHRLQEEFCEIGFNRRIDVTIRNAEEVYKKVQEIRQDSLMASATASATPKTDEDIIKDLLNEIMEKVDALTDKGKGLMEGEQVAEATFTGITRDSGSQQFYNEQDQVTSTVSPETKEEEVEVVHSKDGQHDVEIKVKPHQYEVVRSYGSGELNGPYCIAKNEITGDIAVADYFNKRVLVLDKDMKHVKTIGDEADSQLSASIGSPVSVAFPKNNKHGTKNNDIMVTHEQFRSHNKKLSVLTDRGLFIEHFSEHLIIPHHVFVKTDDSHVIVCDEGDKKVKVISPDGKELLLAFSAPDSEVSPSFPCYYRGRFFVSYMRAHCVKVYDKEGVFLYNIGSEGCGEGQLRYPEGLCVDSFGNLIVCDISSSHENLHDGVLKMFTLDGTFLTSFGEDKIKVPWSVCACNNGDLLVADLLEDSVHILK